MILHSNSMENTILEYCGEYKVAIVEVVRVIESNRKSVLYCYLLYCELGTKMCTK